MLLWIHPIVEGLTAFLAFYVFWLGLQRFAGRHLGKRTVFKWQRHVMLGRVVVAVLALGALGGLIMTYITYGKIFTQSLHFKNGMATLALLLVTWLTGTRLNNRRGGSHVLPVLHMVNNALLLALVAVQAITGIDIVIGTMLR